MTTDSRRPDDVTQIMDRLSERDALDRLIDVVQGGESRTLVVRGDPGVGKSVLLGHLAERASSSGCRVARVVGVQSEMELAFAGLHQMCAPMPTVSTSGAWDGVTVLAVATTAQSRLRYPATMPAPMPREPPVIMATLPVMAPPAPARPDAGVSAGDWALSVKSA